ncbi:hypothetical protein [Nocardia sp. NPDC056000]|uniref:hypothetical protein n=1 Tax=Nocardia sp. NPDC056000 TaxID=3345674 RepID=UPI0035DAF62F
MTTAEITSTTTDPLGLAEKTALVLGADNITECLTFGRISGRNAAAEPIAARWS